MGLIALHAPWLCEEQRPNLTQTGGALSMNIQNLGRSFFVGAVVCLMAGLALGQATDSNIVGMVSDPAGALVPNAKITAINKATNVKYETVSNNAGEYRFNNVPVGLYDITLLPRGFAPAGESGCSIGLQSNRLR